jgi:protoporphyrinogen oxidase
MAKKRIIILGAGLSGLSAAWHLKKYGYDCKVFEKESIPGGLARSKKIKGFVFDYDGHLLHFRHDYTRSFVKRLLKGNLVEHKRSAWVYSHRKMLPYPFQAHLYGLPPKIVRECVVGFLKKHTNIKGRGNGSINLKDWILRNFGSGIAKNFLIPYNNKFWTVPCDRLAYEWAEGFIPKPSLEQVIGGSLSQSCDGLGYNARFFYPALGGINELVRALSSEIKCTYLNSEATGIDLESREVTINSRQREKFDILISTLPLPEMPKLIKEMPSTARKVFSKLSWNSIFNLNLGLSKICVAGKHWIYFPHKGTSFFRIGFPSNFSSSVAPWGMSSLYAEISYPGQGRINKSGMIKRITVDLEKLGVDTGSICVKDVNDIKYGYPVYDKNYSWVRSFTLDYLSANNIEGCGRYGSWKYMSMEDAILDGKRIAENIARK